jgi:hypothetical protein
VDGFSGASETQIVILSALAATVPHLTWYLEHLPNRAGKDAIDIFGKSDGIRVVIELDKHRADQGREELCIKVGMFKTKPIYYISLCYPGTKRMNLSECVKYFGYCADLSKRMGNWYAGFIIQKA